MFRTILLLTASNVFMTFAWYGNLKNTSLPIWKAILISWGIAFFEYCMQVPANKIGFNGNGGPFGLMELKIIQEARKQYSSGDTLGFDEVFSGL